VNAYSVSATRKVSSMMTHRTEMVCLDVDDPLDVNLEKIALSSPYALPGLPR